MQTIVTTVGPLASASANNIALSQTPTSSFTLNGALASGGVATLDTPRRVLFTPSGNESANTFTIVGTNGSNMPQTEVLAGANATTFYTNLDFKTVSSITLASGAAGAITVGTNGIASSDWIRMDSYANAQVSIGTYVTGTVNYTIQGAAMDPNNANYSIQPYQVPWVNSTDSGAVNQTGNILTTYTVSPNWIRVLLNSGTGIVAASITQFSSVTQ